MKQKMLNVNILHSHDVSYHICELYGFSARDNTVSKIWSRKYWTLCILHVSDIP